MKYRISVYSIEEYGKRVDAAGNPHQEDSMYPAFGQAGPTDRLFILCDGMGGHEAGEVASEAVCRAMAASIYASCPDPEGSFTDESVAKALADAYDALDAHDSGSDRKMGTTMTMLKLHAGGASLAHIGDSRLYHVRPGNTPDETRILYVSEDHSLVNQLVKAGQLTPEQARMSNKKNVITRAMQPGLDPRPHADVYHTADIMPGDIFFLCSDGMLEHPQMEDGTYLQYVFSQECGPDLQKIETLRQATAENSDNHTAFLVRVEEVSASDGIPPSQACGMTYVYPTEPVQAMPQSSATQPISAGSDICPSPAANGGQRWPVPEQAVKAQAARTARSRIITIGAVVAAVVVAAALWLLLPGESKVPEEEPLPDEQPIGDVSSMPDGDKMEEVSDEPSVDEDKLREQAASQVRPTQPEREGEVIVDPNAVTLDLDSLNAIDSLNNQTSNGSTNNILNQLRNQDTPEPPASEPEEREEPVEQ